MSISPKELIKLAKACRKAGIKHFKSAEFEFSLTDEVPSKVSQSKSFTAPIEDNKQFESDSLTDEQLLMWSAGSGDGASEDLNEGN